MRLRLGLLALTLLAAPVHADAPESLSTIERLRLENNTLKMAIVVAEFNQLAADIEAAHPGYTFNRRTSQLDAKPAPAKGQP